MAEQAPIDSLIPYPGNPRRGNVDAIVESLEVNGQFQPIIVQKSTGYIVAGNHTWQAAQQLGWPTIAVRRIDVDDESAKRIVLADNRTSDLASYDEPVLLEVLDALGDLGGTGFDELDLSKLRGIVDAPLDLDLGGGDTAPGSAADNEHDGPMAGGDDEPEPEDLPVPQVEIPRVADPVRLTEAEARHIVETITNRGGVAEDAIRSMLRLPPRQRVGAKAARLGVTPPTHEVSDVERVAIGSIEPHPTNPRQGDIGAVAASIAEFGQYRPLVVQQSTGHILAGSHRWMAMRSLGMAEVDVVFVDVDDEAATRILLADNRTSDLGRYDNQALLDMLTQVGTLEATGYELDDVDELFSRVQAGETARYARIVISVPDEKFRQIVQEPWRRYDRWFNGIVDQVGSVDKAASEIVKRLQ